MLEAGDVTLVVDPWWSGSAFNQGWDLVAPTPFGVELFERATHIWFSHEHPDHFSPPFLKQIPAASRSRITVLYQEAADGKVADFCRGLGFRVQLLPDGRQVEIAPDVHAVCGQVPFYDSWLYLRAGGQGILNLNDCVLDNETVIDRVARMCGAVDVMYTQFSYANWVGNAGQKELRQAAAREKLTRIELQMRKFRPRFVVPFASFVWFSHEENEYLNDSVNHVADVARFIRERGGRPLVFYPGDVWTEGEEHDNAASVTKWDVALAGLGERPRGTGREVAFEALQQVSTAYVDRLRTRNNAVLLRLLTRFGIFPELLVYLWDLRRAARFDLARGLRASELPREACHVAMSSESLAYVFRFDWGFDTLSVNGRFEDIRGAEQRLLRVFGVGTLNNTGRRLELRRFLDRRLLQRLLGKLLSRA